MLAALLFLVALAGDYTLARAGLPAVLPEGVPERTVAAAALLVLALPALTLGPGGGRAAPAVVVPAYVLLTGLWGDANVVPLGAALDMVTLILLVLVAVLLMRYDAGRTVATFMWGGLLAAVLFSVAGVLSGGARASVFGGGPNVYSRVTGLGVVCLVWLVGTGRLGYRWMALMPLLLVATVLSGSRGGILATLVAAAVAGYALLRSSGARAGRGVVVVAVATLGVGYLLGERVVRIVDQRIVRLTLDQQYTSGRDHLAAEAWSMIADAPFVGVGLHNYSATLGDGQSATYPHNMFLQHWAEGGLLGLLLLVAAVLAFVRLAVRGRDSFTAVVVAAAGSLFLVASQFSGDYYDQRFFWIYLVLLAGLAGQGEDGAADRPHLVPARRPVPVLGDR